MTNTHDPPARGRSPGVAGLAMFAWFATGIPLLEWLVAQAPYNPGPVPRASVWIAYILVLAGTGAWAGLVMYAAVRLPRGWLRSWLFGILVALAAGASIGDFARLPRWRFIVSWGLKSVVLGIAVGAIIHLVGRLNQRR